MSDATAHRPATWLLRALLALAAVVALLDAWRYRGYLIDDTFISLRYARNLVDGHGLVFNAGEYVEGYTNFLFVLIAALCLRLGIDPIAATRAVSLGAAFLALIGLARLETGRDRRGPAWALLLLLPLETFAYWSVASFETMLFTGLFLAALARLLVESARGRGHGSAMLFVLLALTRPEGVFLFGVCTACCWLVDTLRAADRWAPWRRHAGNAGLFALGFGPYFLWRFWYYGRPFPNTFYAKVTGGSAQLVNGLHYLGEWAAAHPPLAAALLLPLALVTRRGREAVRAVPEAAVVYLIALAHTAYIVSVGGDFMPFFRFFLPVMPLCALLVAWALRALAPGRAQAALIVLVLAGAFASHATEQPYRAFVAHQTAVVGERVGAWLRGLLVADTLIAVNTAGAVPYASGLPTIDMLGLTDAAIAARPVYIVSAGWAGHRKGWGDYVVRRQPRVVLWYNSAGSREPFYLGDRELADHPMFRFFYRARAAHLPLRDEASTEQPLARFLGNPFEVGAGGVAHSPDLGMRAELIEQPLAHTILYARPVDVSYFELDPRDLDLWPLHETTPIPAFVDAIADRWQALPLEAPPDLTAQAIVEGLCDDARQAVEAGEIDHARRLLSTAAQRNGEARSPLVYQYIANLAVMTGDLFVAVNAQKEALRLAPDNALYRRNLASLLALPYKDAAKRRQSSDAHRSE